MSALGRVVRSGVGRRRVQTVVIGLVALIAVTSSVLGGTLLVASTRPFDRAFGQQHGAHLIAGFDAAKVTAEQVAASAAASGVAETAGPFRTATIDPVDDGREPFGALVVAGRAQPSGGVDTVTLIRGRWATKPGEIVLFDDGRLAGRSRSVGRVLTLESLPGGPTLTIVGHARSISGSAGGWVAPEQITALEPDGYQMLYRLSAAGTDGQVEAGRAAVAATVPAGALIASRSWLAVRQEAAGEAALFVPFLMAFGVIGLAMAVLIVGNVIAGAVSTGTRRIGILKALGFSPGQVVRAYLAQALIPAAVGALLGVLTGNALAIPVLSQTNDLYGTSDAGVEPWVDVAVLAGILGLVAVTALVAASRAGRLRTVDALAVGRTPSAGRGRWAARLTARLPLPRPVTLGLAHPFARPVRSVTIIVAIAFGTAAVIFSIGLAASLNRIQDAESLADVMVEAGQREGPQPGRRPADQPPAPSVRQPAGTAPDPDAVLRAIAAQPGTRGWCGTVRAPVSTTALTGKLEALATTGDSCAESYRMVNGAWYGGPGEIVVATPFLTHTGTRVGDTVTLTSGGSPVTVRITGEVFNTENDGLEILTPIETFADPRLKPLEFRVYVTPGTAVQQYSDELDIALGPLGAFVGRSERGTPEAVLIINGLTALLSLLLVAVAALGVLNTVVLETRERVHDLGVHKALGMAPRQTIAMVIASVVVTGLAGGVIGAPAGMLLQRHVVAEMGWSAGFRLPAEMLDTYHPGQLVLLGAGGLVIAVLGALLPAGWAARTRTATALRTE
ncbi:ABC transporter permease [Actinoplanes sp. CA-252034]|uniref:ABC transporter permease n=1 Tax=Actinoplanes sp. CA-252034 TaxID=3239906 RepID=UPI003D957324